MGLVITGIVVGTPASHSFGILFRTFNWTVIS